MQEQVTVCFVGTKQLKELLEQWAKEEDRSISAVMRQILQREVLRREIDQQSEIKQTN